MKTHEQRSHCTAKDKRGQKILTVKWHAIRIHVSGSCHRCSIWQLLGIPDSEKHCHVTSKSKCFISSKLASFSSPRWLATKKSTQHHEFYNSLSSSSMRARLSRLHHAGSWSSNLHRCCAWPWFRNSAFFLKKKKSLPTPSDTSLIYL